MDADSKPPIPPPAEPETLNVACPHCAAHTTKTLSVSTRKGDVELVDVTMRCTECNHTWIVQKLTNDLPPA